MPTTATADRLDSLTGIRAVAVVLVFWHHGNEFYEGGVSAGMVGVSLFYLLSGFVMAWTDRSSDTAWQFYRRRFARIYPAYFVAVTVAVGMLVVSGNFGLVDLSAYTLLQSWVPSSDFNFAANAVFWSLSCEAFFYLMFPLIRTLTRGIGVRGLWLLGIGAAMVSVSIASVGSLFPYEGTAVWAVVIFPVSRLPEFVIGVCLGALMARGWRPNVPLVLAFLLAAVGVCAALFVPPALSRYAVTLIPFAVLIVALASSDLRDAPAFTRWGWMVKLGVWSYCFYLVHLMVLAVVVRFTNQIELPVWVGIAVSLAIAIVASWALHVLVERPAERLLRPTARPRLDSDALTR